MITQQLALIRIPNQRLFGMKAAVQHLGVSEDSLRSYSDLGMVKACRLNRRRVFRLEDLDGFIDSLPEY